VTSEHVKILWDFTISTNRFDSANWVDIVVYGIFNRSVILLDVADVNIVSKEQEKISKYQMESYNYHNISYCYWVPGVQHFYSGTQFTRTSRNT